MRQLMCVAGTSRPRSRTRPITVAHCTCTGAYFAMRYRSRRSSSSKARHAARSLQGLFLALWWAGGGQKNLGDSHPGRFRLASSIKHKTRWRKWVDRMRSSTMIL